VTPTSALTAPAHRTSHTRLAVLGLLAVTAAWGSTFYLIKDVVERVPVAVVDTATTLADVTAVADAAQAAGKRLVLLSAIEAPGVVDGRVPGEFVQVVDEVVSVVALSLVERPTGPYEFDLDVWRAVAPTSG